MTTELLVTGAGGLLGSVLMRVLVEERKAAVGMVSAEGPKPHFGKVIAADLCDVPGYEERVFSLAPKVIVHLAAVSQISRCYEDPELAQRVNVDATASLLQLSAALGARFIHASTDLVFDGGEAPYDEDAATEPASLYGRSKLEAECHVLTYKRGLVVRLPLMYGVPEVDRQPSFFERQLQALSVGERISLFEDEVRTPLWLDDAAHALLALSDSSVTGVLHAGGPERLSRYEMGECVASALGVGTASLIKTSIADHPSSERRAADVSLDSARFRSRFGRDAGRAMHEALPLIVARAASKRLS